MTKQLPIDPDVLARFCTQHQIRRLSLFGSMLTDAVNPASDIDLLVEFEPGKEPGLIGMGQLETEDCRLGGLDAAVDSQQRIYILDLVTNGVRVMKHKA